MNLLLLLFGLLLSLFQFGFQAVQAGQIYIPVGEAKIKQSLLAFPDTRFLPEDDGGARGKLLSRTIKEQILSDLEWMMLFKFQSKEAFIEKSTAGLTIDSFRMSDWTTIGTEFLIKSGVAVKNGDIIYELRLYDVLGGKQILGNRYGAGSEDSKNLSHTIANEIIETLTGKPGIFFSKLAMICDKSGFKEIWVTDFDGSNPKQITLHNSLVIGPAWSPDGKKLAYSFMHRNSKNIKNIDLYEYDFATKASRLLSNRKGINSGASYSPDGKKIALTMSFLGNPEIFMLDPVTR